MQIPSPSNPIIASHWHTGQQISIEKIIPKANIINPNPSALRTAHSLGPRHFITAAPPSQKSSLTRTLEEPSVLRIEFVSDELPNKVKKQQDLHPYDGVPAVIICEYLQICAVSDA